MPKQTNQNVATAVQTHTTSPKQHAQAPLNKLRPGRLFSFSQAFCTVAPGAVACVKIVSPVAFEASYGRDSEYMGGDSPEAV